MKKIFLLMAVSTLLCEIALAGNFDANFETEPRVANVTENSFTVMFTTGKNSLCWVEVAPDDGTVWYQSARRKCFQDISGRHYLGRKHRITIDGLKAGESYRYRVMGKEIEDFQPQRKIAYGRNFAWNPEWGTGVKWARICTIRTLDRNASECRFSMVNDTHYNDELLRNLTSAMPAGNDFLLLNGDIASFCQDIDTVVRHCFYPIREIASTKPVFYAKGNHENRGADSYLLGSEFPTKTGEFYYSFRQGPAAFIVLDAGEDKPDSDIEYYGTAAFDEYRLKELEWLKKEVENPEFKSAPQKICIIHIPAINGKEAWSTQKWISENYTPVLEKAGIKLMLSGHEHKYRLSKAGENGCKFAIVVNSNKDRADVTVTSSSIHVEIKTADGSTLHSLDF